MEKILLGISLAIPIGPVNIAIMIETLNKNVFSAIKIRLGAIIGCIVHLIITIKCINIIQNYIKLINIFQLIGGICLIMRTKNKNIYFSSDSNVKDHKYKNILYGLTLSISNPISIIFWITNCTDNIYNNNYKYDIFIIIGIIIWSWCFGVTLYMFKKILYDKKTLQNVVLFSNILMIIYGNKYILNYIKSILI